MIHLGALVSALNRGGEVDEERLGRVIEAQSGPGVPGCCGSQRTTKLHLSAWVSKELCLSVCRLAQRLISQSASPLFCVLGQGWVRPLR